MSVLADWQLRALCEDQKLVTPYDSSLVQPASIDLRLASHLRIYSETDTRPIDPDRPDDLDLRSIYMAHGGFLLRPNQFALGCTEESVAIPPQYVGRIEGKSSRGRIGLIVHVTAGYVDPGFYGVLTLEMLNVNSRPILLRPGMRIAQLSVLEMAAPPEQPYNGRYQGQTTTTPAR
jgi:dCTP deaminase